LRAPVVEALAELQVAGGTLVESQVVLEGEGLDPREVRGRRLLRLLQVGQDGSRCPEGAASPGKPEPLDGRDPEVGAEPVLGLAKPEARRVPGGHGHARRAEAREQRVVRCERRRDQHFRGTAQEERVGQALRVARLAHQEVGGRHVDQRHAEVIRGAPERGEEVVDAPVEETGVGDGPRSDEPDDLPADELAPLALGGLDLVADRDLQAGPYESRDVRVHGVVRHPRHRDRALPLLPGRQRDVERAGRHRRVLVERLVEVAEPEEQEVVRVAPLPLLVLAHHRCEGRVRHRMRGRSGSGLGDVVHQSRGWKARQAAATALGRGRGPTFTC
jgi:hypothetical protein